MARSTKLRFTRAGVGLAVAAAAMIAGGLLAGYMEFVILGASIIVVLIIAALIPRVATSIVFQRVEVPRLVVRGSVFEAVLTVTSSHTTLPTVVIDQFAGQRRAIELPQLEPGLPTTLRYPVHATRRGVHRLGPLLEERSDPFALVVRSVRHDVTAEVHVHPVIHPLRLPQSGGHLRQAGAVVNRFSRDPIADFRSLREYVVGDDARLVHWASTAKTGTLVVRDHIEPQRTTRFVVLETSDRWLTAAAFEDAVEIASSIVCESLELGINVVARTFDHDAPGPARALRTRQEALELFTRVQRTGAAATLRSTQLRLNSEPGDQIFLIAGATSPVIAQLAGNPLFAQSLYLVRLHDGVVARQGARRSVDVTNAEQFAALWRRGSGFA